MKTEDLVKKIETEISWWEAEHKHQPNVAHVKVSWDEWSDREAPEDNIETIVIDKDYYENDLECVPYIKDEDVLYYCSSIESLIWLCYENNGADFKIVDFVGFERIKE